MALTPGTHFGPYEILSTLGVGGMGEVYRARDTKLGRDVALKILPDTVAQDVDRVARFKREAQVLAALNHPHIAAIYGFEEAPSTSSDHAGGTQFLVLELVEGETLADRLKRGPIPADEAIAIARQIADALAEAHEKGIIHRDLKPANVALTGNDQVKVLDFGLAKLAATTRSAVSSGLSMSPTLTTPAMTAMGTILGTAAYMAPEQAKGRDADKRSDLWAFGCVVYEMLTAKQAFQGEDVLDTLTAIMRGEPDWNALPAGTPANVRLLIELCLTKDRSQRAADIAVAQFLFGDRAKLASPTPLATMNALPREPTWRRALPSAASLVVGSLLAGAAVWLVTRPATPRITRTTIATSGPAALTINGTDRNLALSPDGTHVVYVGNNATQIFVRALDTLEPLAITSSAGLRGPFISPDGRWVGFQDGAWLRKVAISGGPPITLANIGSIGRELRGATWMPDDTIIFATASPATGLLRVSAAGGTPEVVTRPDGAHGELDHLWPESLPGGRAVLFTITSPVGGPDAAQVVVRDLRTGTNKVLVRGGSHGYYVATGHLVYVAAGTLRAIPFDLTRLETHGTAVPVLPRLTTTPTGAGNYGVATDGTLVYVDVPGSLAGNGRTIVWIDRTGKEEPVAAPGRAYELPRLSPDGTRVALSIADQEEDLWIAELGRGTLTRLTLDPGRDWFPVWTPDGRRIVFSSTRSGVPNLWWQAADGTGAAERLTTSSNPQFVTGITPDAAAVVFNEQTPTMGRDLMQLALDGTRRVTPLLQTKFDERNGIVSPDGRWLAYESNSSGTFEIYIRPFPDVGGGQWEVSTVGGREPLWSRSGKELFYVSADGTLLRVPVEASGAIWHAGTPTKLLDRRSYVSGGTGTGRTYDVSPDGQRTCGAGLEARSRSHGKQRVVFYGCSAYHRRGCSVCRNALTVPMKIADDEIIKALERSWYLLNPQVLKVAVHRVVDRVCQRRKPASIAAFRRDLATAERELANLSDAIAQGGDVPSLLDAMRRRETERAALLDQIARSSSAVTVKPDDVVAELQDRLKEWRDMLRDQTPKARRLLKQLIIGRVQMAPDREQRRYRFQGTGTLVPLFSGVMSVLGLGLGGESPQNPPHVPQSVASPTGFEPVFWP